MSRGRSGGHATDRGRGPGGARSTAITPLKGLFIDGSWHCNCTPRLPANRFQTRKQGPNHGRWFYTCQKAQSERCNFFLWDDDAKMREEAALLSNSRSEPVPDSGAPSNRYSTPLSPPPPYSAVEVSSNFADASVFVRDGSNERTTEGDLPQDWLISSEGQQRPLHTSGNTTDTGRKRATQQPETPRKAPTEDPRQQSRSPPYFTALPTPSTERTSRSLFTTPSASTLRTASPAERDTAQFLTPSVTPTPSRFRDIGSIGSGEDSSLSEEILEILDKSCLLSKDIREKIKNICNRHSLRTQGIAKGRDLSRLAIKTKEVKIAELQGRIASLEAEKESDMITIKDLKRQLAAREKP
ncbi:MAG: hypothetical protein M1816_005350 [Peltula sp. TS41687]|nr:MAG: hypothetical protein M1816_005350 [Peltula sp. TS41687]